MLNCPLHPFTRVSSSFEFPQERPFFDARLRAQQIIRLQDPRSSNIFLVCFVSTLPLSVKMTGSDEKISSPTKVPLSSHQPVSPTSELKTMPHAP
jgi:hypothetical protein